MAEEREADAVVTISEPEGWTHVKKCLRMLEELKVEIFALPGAAQERAIEARGAPDSDHGGDLLCGCWCAAEAATAMLELMGRHLEAIVVLGTAHPAFFTPAHTLGRAVVEHGLRIQWLLQPSSPEQREERWLAFEDEQLRALKALPNPDPDDLVAAEERIGTIREALGRQIAVGLPSAETMAREFSPKGAIYSLYRWMSQATHGTSLGASTFHMDNRFEWNDYGGDGEWVEAEFWAMPLAASWEAACGAASGYRSLLCPEQQLLMPARAAEFRASLRSIPPNFQARDSQMMEVHEAPVMNRAQRRRATRKKQ